MFETSCIELSKSALRNNLSFLRKQFGKDVTISSVVKGNAYGHGIDSFVPLAEECGMRHFSVFNTSEAVEVRKCLRHSSEIMITGCVEGEGLEWAIGNGVSFYVYDVIRLEQALAVARRLDTVADIHLELETGLNRTGLKLDELQRAVEIIGANREFIKVEGVCTHYAGAESIANYKRIMDQIALFNERCDYLNSAGIEPRLRHSAASAAALLYPKTRMDLVRIGIAHYGFWPSKETEMQFLINNGGVERVRRKNPLRRVLRWCSSIMAIKEIPAGEFVGYGNSYLTTRKLRVAAVPVGYFHGFSRQLSNLGRVLVRGKRVGIVGTVNMNMLLVNISEIKDVRLGDEVVIIGKQNRSQISVSSFSDLSNLLNYEALVRLPAEIPRVVVD